MSLRYKGGRISATPPTTTGGESGVASGSWTLEQQLQAQGAGNWPTPVPDPSVFIENLFSTYIYTGNGSTQTITNGIDLSTKGGLVWAKDRTAANSNWLYDTTRGVNASISSNLTNAQGSVSGVTAFNTNGFGIGTNGALNTTSNLYASWTFREQAKFFDVVTYTGNGQTNGAGPDISHSLGSKPGFMLIKCTSAGSTDWVAVARNTDTNYYTLKLNTTDAELGGNASSWMTSTTFNPSKFAQFYGAGPANTNGATYVAYIFAHNAGGFGLTGTDNVISCGSFTQGSGDTAITLGYEPQWVMIKNTNTGGSWVITDNMRAMPVSGSASSVLNPDLSNAEGSSIYGLHATSTGFISNGFTSGNFIYIAIRKGPMKVPTLGTTVFSSLYTSSTSGATNTTNFPVDLQLLSNYISGSGLNFVTSDRLRGVSSNATETGKFLVTSTTDAESGAYLVTEGWNNTGFVTPSVFAGVNYLTWNFKRAPSFFDEVCYTGTGSLPGVTHNLGVTPELKIIKRRNSTTDWVVGGSIIGENGYVFLNTTAAFTSSSNYWDGGNDSATVFSVRNTNSMSDASGGTYVAYLFATCAGVSKVGSYTGTAALQTINCGFTSGARFVLIKRTDSTGDWYAYDSLRGISSGNDPYILINSSAAQVTGTNYVDTDTTGFKVTATAPVGLNASGGTYIFLAIA